MCWVPKQHTADLIRRCKTTITFPPNSTHALPQTTVQLRLTTFQDKSVKQNLASAAGNTGTTLTHGKEESVVAGVRHLDHVVGVALQHVRARHLPEVPHTNLRSAATARATRRRQHLKDARRDFRDFQKTRERARRHTPDFSQSSKFFFFRPFT